MKSDVSERLNILRQRAGISMQSLALKMGLKGASSIQRYFDGYPDKNLPIKITMKFADALEGIGEPPINKNEVLALANPNFINKPGEKPPYLMNVVLSEEEMAGEIYKILRSNDIGKTGDELALAELYMRCVRFVAKERRGVNDT